MIWMAANLAWQSHSIRVSKLSIWDVILHGDLELTIS